MIFVVLLWVYIHTGQTDEYAYHDGNQTYDLKNANPRYAASRNWVQFIRYRIIFSRSGFPLNPVIWLADERSGFSLYEPLNRTANGFP